MLALWYRALGGALAPWAARWGQGGDARAMAQRLGHELPRGESWLHAASLGEASGIPPLVEEWRRLRAAEDLVTSAVTPGGRAALSRALPGVPVCAPPVDSLGVARRSLRAVGARRLVLFETELWPAWLAAALEAGVRVAVANARLSDRAWARTRLARSLFRPLVARFCAVAAQTALDAERWTRLGVPAHRVRVTGNTKFDAEPGTASPSPEQRRAARRRLGIDPDGVWWTWGSLRPGEERRLGSALARLGPSGAKALVVPRHPERWRDPERRPGDGDGARWLLGLGILAEAYRAADFAVVGGTLEPYGGHNPIEPAALGVPVLLGPSLENCRPAAARLLERGGARLVTSDEELAAAIHEWTADPGGRERAGEAARAVALEMQGASRRTLGWFEERGLWA